MTPAWKARALAGLVAVGAALAFVGCGSANTSTGDLDTTPRAAGPAIAGTVTPVAIRIPSIGVDRGGIVSLGKLSDGTLVVPDVHNPMVPGWWNGGATPGDPGTSVIVGHVDGGTATHHTHGVFYDLSKVKKGAKIAVDRADGMTATFTVNEVRKTAKDVFPTADFYSAQAESQLHLATCGGRYVPPHVDGNGQRVPGNYLDSWQVYASLSSLAPTTRGGA